MLDHTLSDFHLHFSENFLFLLFFFFFFFNDTPPTEIYPLPLHAPLPIFARRGTGELVTPRRVELREGTGSREMYEAHFGCPATLNARENTIVFGKADLDRPFLKIGRAHV